MSALALGSAIVAGLECSPHLFGVELLCQLYTHDLSADVTLSLGGYVPSNKESGR